MVRSFARSVPFILLLPFAASSVRCVRSSPVAAPTSPVGYDVSQDVHSGTRILAKRYGIEGAAGGMMFTGWRDRELDVDCVFHTAADGITRCLPGATWLYTHEYLDDTCTQYVLERRAPDCREHQTTYAYWTEPDCSDRRHIHRLGEVLPPDTKVYWRDDSGACRAKKPMKGRELVRVGEEIPAARFVEGRAVRGPAGAELAPVFMTTADGARGFETWHDVRRDIACEFADLGTVTACVPADTTTLLDQPDGLFSDPDCKAQVSQGCPTKYAEHLADIDAGADKPVCDHDLQYFELGPEVKAAYHYDDTPDEPDPSESSDSSNSEADQGDEVFTAYNLPPPTKSCKVQKEPLDKGEVYRTVGARIPSSAFPAEVNVEPLGSGIAKGEPPSGPNDSRFILTRTRTSDGFLDSGDWYDKQTHDYCRLATTADGASRCIPHMYVLPNDPPYFMDASCKRRALITDDCSPPPTMVATREPGCATPTRIFEAQPPTRIDAYYTFEDGACTERKGSSLNLAITPGAEIPPSKFPMAKKVER